MSPLAVPAGRDEGVRFLEELAARYGLRVSHVTDTLKWWTVHLSALDGGAGVPVAEYEGHTGKWSGFGAGRLDPGEVAAYLAARGEGDLHDAPAGPSDPYTRIGPARYDYHMALLAYQALRETKAGRSLMETQDTDKPRPDAIALNAAYHAVSGGWKKAFAGEAEEVTGRFAAWEHTARVMAGNLAATRHRAGIFRAALDAFTESAGHLASRTRATAEDPGAWARVSEGLPRSAQAAGPAPGEAAATGDTPQTAVPGPASQPETPRPSSSPVAAQDTSGAAQPPPASPEQPASASPGAQAREAASDAPAPDLTNADPGAAPQAMPPGGAAPQSTAPGEDTAARAEETRTLTLGDLTGPSPDWMSASLCEWCGKLHGGDCPAPVTAPPPGLHSDDDELTPLGAVVEDAARYLAMRGYLDPDADGGVPDWVLAELAEIAREKPCGGPGCSRNRRRLPRPVTRSRPLPPAPPAGMGTLAAQVGMYLRQVVQGLPRTARHRLLRDHPGRDAGRPRGPRHARREAAGRQGLRRLPRLWPPVRRYHRRPAGHAPGRRARTRTVRQPGARTHPVRQRHSRQHNRTRAHRRPGGRPRERPGNSPAREPRDGLTRRSGIRNGTRRDGTPVPQPEPLPAADPYTDPGQAQADYRKAVHDYMEMGYTKAGHTLVRDLPSLPPPATRRPDALALDAAWCAASGRRSFRESFAGDAQEVADRFTALAQAASAMARNLAAERYRAPKFREALDTFTASATRLASRTQATAQNPDAWAACSQAAPPGLGPPARSPGSLRHPATLSRPPARRPPRHGRPRQTRRPRTPAAANPPSKARSAPVRLRCATWTSPPNWTACQARCSPGGSAWAPRPRRRATWTTSATARARRRPSARTASRSRSADRTSPGTGW